MPKKSAAAPGSASISICRLPHGSGDAPFLQALGTALARIRAFAPGRARRRARARRLGARSARRSQSHARRFLAGSARHRAARAAHRHRSGRRLFVSGSAAESDRVPAPVRSLRRTRPPRPVRSQAGAQVRGLGRAPAVRAQAKPRDDTAKSKLSVGVHPAARVHAVRVLRLRRCAAHRRRRLRQQPSARMPLDRDRADAAAGARQLRRRDRAVGDVSGSGAVRLRRRDRRAHGAAAKHRSAHHGVPAARRRPRRRDHRRLHGDVRAGARRRHEGPPLLRALERPLGLRRGVSRTCASSPTRSSSRTAIASPARADNRPPTSRCI